MNLISKQTTTALFIFGLSVNNAFGGDAEDKAAIKAFYAFLSHPTSDAHKSAAMNVMADDWQSIGNYSGENETRDAFLQQVPGFGKLIPDLNWEIVEMLQDGDRYIVRGRATGTPQGPFMGVDGQGRGFDIMSIDIHTVEDGMITESYHVEDWAGAMQQLGGQ